MESDSQHGQAKHHWRRLHYNGLLSVSLFHSRLHSQRLQYPLIKAYTLNYSRIPNKIQGIRTPNNSDDPASW